MTDTDMKAMCDSAMVRVQGWIARSAGQHIRQMREQHRMTDSEFLSDLLYCGFNGELPEATIEEACARFNIPFPPERYNHETNCIGAGKGSKRVRASTQNAHQPSVPNEVRQLVSMY